MSESIRERQAAQQEPATDLSEWEIAGKRAIFECTQQLTQGAYNIHTILHILEKAAA